MVPLKERALCKNLVTMYRLQVIKRLKFVGNLNYLWLIHSSVMYKQTIILVKQVLHNVNKTGFNHL